MQTVSRCLESLRRYCDRDLFRLYVAGNHIDQTVRRYLESLMEEGFIDRLFFSDTNIHKCPMMRRMFAEVQTEFVWWLDDDSHVFDALALPSRLEIARSSALTTVMWGHVFYQNHAERFGLGADVVGYVKSTPWYRGKNPPSWEPGGKGEYNYDGGGTGDGRWFYICGACWFIRTSTLLALDWPDHSLLKPADDVFLCEAIRQNNWEIEDIGPTGVMINDGPRRGNVENLATMNRQISFYDPNLA